MNDHHRGIPLSLIPVKMCEFYFWFKYDLGQKYNAPQVRLNWGLNS